MKIFIKNIKSLYGTHSQDVALVKGSDMNVLPSIENAWLAIEDNTIVAFGSMDEFDGIEDWRDLTIIDAAGKFVLPGWCDSHTHTVFAASRADEFEDRLNGLTYEEIAKRGGGILNSAKKLSAMSEEELYSAAVERLNGMMQQGTVAVEIKSGYGLDEANELKMLRVIQRLKVEHPMEIKATFLALHAIPSDYKGREEEFVQLMIKQVLPKVAAEGLADFVDAFCEEGYFTVDQMNELIDAAQAVGIPAKVHVNQFNVIGGVEAAVKRNARSVDHLEELSNEDVEALSHGNTMPVALPACSFFLRIPYTPARKIIDAGLPIALATDFNPGSSPSGNMNFVNSLACIQQRMLPREVVNASTLNGAYAMDVQNILGSITVGKKASLIITKPLNSLTELFYYFGENNIDQVIVNGKLVDSKAN
ncbi:MAG: imidazolonepropionase [Flavobacteriales bacterium]|jgi:imidazolonepropionase